MTITIKPAKTIEECELIADLIMHTWGDDPIEAIPPSLSMAGIKNGCAILIAWQGKEAVGFCWSFPGYETVNKQSYQKHHSHMAAVIEPLRSAGIGAKIKWAQLNFIWHQGCDLMTWTFDPLETRNARMNLRKLGAVCNTYIRDCYGTRDDNFNTGLPTDRFHVHWWLDSRRVWDRRMGQPIKKPDIGRIQPFNTTTVGPNWLQPGKMLGERIGEKQLFVTVPKAYQALRKADMPLASDWRYATRELFEHAFAAGYYVNDLVVDENSCHYILTHTLRPYGPHVK